MVWLYNYIFVSERVSCHGHLHFIYCKKCNGMVSCCDNDKVSSAHLKTFTAVQMLSEGNIHHTPPTVVVFEIEWHAAVTKLWLMWMTSLPFMWLWLQPIVTCVFVIVSCQLSECCNREADMWPQTSYWSVLLNAWSVLLNTGQGMEDQVRFTWNGSATTWCDITMFNSFVNGKPSSFMRRSENTRFG